VAARSTTAVTFHPLTVERWPDFVELFGPKGGCAGCWCMWPRRIGREFRDGAGEPNKRAFRKVVERGEPPGLLAYVDGAAAAWCGFAPRDAYPRLENSRVLARVDERPVWSVVCFFVARPFRRRGLTVRLLREACRHVATRGARVLEGYPVDPRGAKTADAFAWTGLADAFVAAGFHEVERRSPSRPIMRKTLRAPRAPRG
jgi:GNAT superfamily N-acetyltransferase